MSDATRYGGIPAGRETRTTPDTPGDGTTPATRPAGDTGGPTPGASRTGDARTGPGADLAGNAHTGPGAGPVGDARMATRAGSVGDAGLAGDAHSAPGAGSVGDARSGPGGDAGPVAAGERTGQAAGVPAHRASGTGTAAGATGGGTLLPHEECDRLGQRLHHAVAGFVDAPRASVEEADRVLEELTARFTDAVTHRRRTLRTSWHDTGDDHRATSTDTEQLRLALRDYRELVDRLMRL